VDDLLPCDAVVRDNEVIGMMTISLKKGTSTSQKIEHLSSAGSTTLASSSAVWSSLHEQKEVF